MREMGRDHTEEAIETPVDLMRHAKSMAVAMDLVDDGRAHLEALSELAAAPEHQRLGCISREKDTTEAT